jgi:hypothetical protein
MVATPSVLQSELEQLEMAELKKIAQLWNLHKFSAKDKKSAIHSIIDGFKDEFQIKGVLEKFSPLQTTIYSSILKNKGVLTLGEISRKINLPPINVEMELNVLRKYFLLYQRKNRERLTNNLDKYHAYEETASLVKLESNSKGEKFKYSLEKSLHKEKLADLPKEWIARYKKKFENTESFLKHALSPEGIQDLLHSLDDAERDTLHQIYVSGGVIESATLRNYIQVQRGKFEVLVPKLIQLHLIRDNYYLEDKFIRVFILPSEVVHHFQTHPILPSVKQTTKQRQEKIATNELDFFLNIKKLFSYISRKGLNLAKSGKVKQADHKKTETELLKPDLEIFPEKSQVYQIEVILPILRLMGYVEVKEENVILQGDWEDFIQKDIFEVMRVTIHEVNEARSRRLNLPEVFLPNDVAFYDKLILDKVVKLITHQGKINLYVVFSNIIREHLIFAPSFQIKSFQTDLANLRKEILSAVFYLHLFGLIEVEYPHRNLSISSLGKHYFHQKAIHHTSEKGGITINPDFSIIAYPDRMSLFGTHLLKAFCELKSYDRVYNFHLTKDAYQLGILLGYSTEQFLNFLRETSRGELSQNLLFLLQDWGSNLPIVHITEDSVLLRTKDQTTMDLLLGQIKGKKFVQEEISPTAIIIEKSKVMEVIAISEKLNLIIKLIR